MKDRKELLACTVLAITFSASCFYAAQERKRIQKETLKETQELLIKLIEKTNNNIEKLNKTAKTHDTN